MNVRAQISLRIAAGCLLLAALADAGLLWRQIGQLRIQLTSVTGRQATADASVTAARSRIAAQKRAVAAARNAARAAESQPAAANVQRPGRINVNDFLEADPKLMALYLKSFHANLSDRFGPLFQRLGLTPYQIEKWEDLATAIEQNNVDLRAAAAAQGLTYSTDPGIQAMKKQRNDSLGEAYRAAVGADVAQQINAGMQGYTAVPNGMVPMVTNIATWSAQNGTPMDYQQMGEVGTILASNFAPNPLLGGSFDWDKAAAQAATTLSAPQADAVQTMVSLYQLSTKVKQFYAQQGATP